MDDDENVSFPWVATVDVGTLPDKAIGLRILSSRSAEQAQARRWDEHYFGMSNETAIALATNILIATGQIAGPEKAQRQ